MSTYWKRYKPVIIQALVDLAALIRPLLNTSFNLGLRTKLLAPPVTEITRLGISRFHLSSINFRMSWTSVSCDTRTYYGYKKGDLGLLSRNSVKDIGESLSLTFTHMCHTRLPSTTLPILPDKHKVFKCPPPRGFIKGQALGKLTGCEDGFFFHLVWPSTEQFILQRSSVQKVLPACENQLPYSWKRQWNPYPPPPPFTPFTNTRTSHKTLR